MECRNGFKAVNRYSEMAKRLSYAEIMDKIGGRIKAVYDALIFLNELKVEGKKGVSSEEVAKHLDIGLYRVSPRMGELSDLGLVMEVGKGKTECGRECALWIPVKSDLQYNFNFTRDDIIGHTKRGRRVKRHSDSAMRTD